MKYSSSDIAQIIKAELLNESLISSEIRWVSYDTRKIVFAKKNIFFAFPGLKNDGHNYLKKAYDLGIRNFVVSEEVAVLPEANYFKVENTLQALQNWASYHRLKFNIPCIAITGSYGKTIIKDWLYSLLKEKYAVVKSPKSYNSQIGVALSLLRIQKHHDYAIIEAGISEPGEMEKLEEMIQPQIGILSNIGDAHSYYFQSDEQKLNEKLRLFKKSKSTFLPKGVLKQFPDQSYPDGFHFIDQVQYDDWIPFADKASKNNLSLCLAVLEHLNVNLTPLKANIAKLTPPKMRLELIKGGFGNIILNDAYIADASSLEMALNSLAAHADGKEKILCLSDFDITEKEKTVEYGKVENLIRAFDWKEIWLVGNDLKAYLPKEITHVFSNNQELINYIKMDAPKQAAILVKGARRQKLEEIVDQLTIQGHDTCLEINLSALAHNIKAYAKGLNPSTEIIGVIKAGAYGSGSVDIAKTLMRNGVSYLAVAFTDEAMELRKQGIEAPIIILNSQLTAQESWFENDLQPIIFSVDQMESLAKMSKQKNRTISYHLNLNTGMNRLGLDKGELDDFLAFAKNDKLQLESVFTHLSSSEDPSDDAYSHLQVEKFETLCTALSEALGTFKKHVLNTTGILRFPQYQMDAVRMGLGLYGINMSPNEIDLVKVHTLKSKIIQIKVHDIGQTIGYNRKYKTDRLTQIATIPIGYADGLPRKAGNGRYSVMIKGQEAVIVGNICMDLIMVDVTDIKNIRVNEEVIIFNDELPIEKLASICDTIPYEILSNVAPRVKRILIHE